MISQCGFVPGDHGRNQTGSSVSVEIVLDQLGKGERWTRTHRASLVPIMPNIYFRINECTRGRAYSDDGAPWTRPPEETFCVPPFVYNRVSLIWMFLFSRKSAHDVSCP